jgi:hypothetical protein
VTDLTQDNDYERHTAARQEGKILEPVLASGLSSVLRVFTKYPNQGSVFRPSLLKLDGTISN